MTRIARKNGTVVTALSLAILVTLSCSKGYNKYADEHYAQGKIFYENMEYGRSIDSFSKVLELAPAGEENNRIFYMRGRSYLKDRQYDKAIYDFSKALELTGEGAVVRAHVFVRAAHNAIEPQAHPHGRRWSRWND